ncbi:HNH endonuclease [bacterium]|nr:HNH endonuclease [bacterium]
MRKSLIDRFEEKIASGKNGCILWTAGRNGDGYSQFFANGKPISGHLWIWKFLNGKISAGLQIDHKCRARHCVNLDHLELVTPRENTLRGETLAARNAAKTHCPRGHLFDRIRASSGERFCGICRRNLDRKRYSPQKRRLRYLKSKSKGVM